MGAYVCSACVVNFPLRPEYQKCPICKQPTSPDMTAPVSEDYQWRIETALWPSLDDLDWFRVERMQKFGLPTEVALEWAPLRYREGGYVVDLTDLEREFRRLLSLGATVDQAVRILCPLVW